MTNSVRVASAAGNSQSNDHGYPDEFIDDLASMFIRNARGRIRDDDLRLRVLARAFAVEYVECRYDGDPFECLGRAESFAGEEVATRILDVDPSLYDDADLDDLDDTEDGLIEDYNPINEDSDPFDEFCESEFCDGCCDECPIEYACIPVFVSDRIEMRVVLRRRDSDDRAVRAHPDLQEEGLPAPRGLGGVRSGHEHQA